MKKFIVLMVVVLLGVGLLTPSYATYDVLDPYAQLTTTSGRFLYEGDNLIVDAKMDAETVLDVRVEYNLYNVGLSFRLLKMSKEGNIISIYNYDTLSSPENPAVTAGFEDEILTELIFEFPEEWGNNYYYVLETSLIGQTASFIPANIIIETYYLTGYLSSTPSNSFYVPDTIIGFGDIVFNDSLLGNNLQNSNDILNAPFTNDNPMTSYANPEQFVYYNTDIGLLHFKLDIEGYTIQNLYDKRNTLYIEIFNETDINKPSYKIPLYDLVSYQIGQNYTQTHVGGVISTSFNLTSIDVTNYLTGYIPIIIDPNSSNIFHTVGPTPVGEHFAKDSNAMLYDVILNQNYKDMPITLQTYTPINSIFSFSFKDDEFSINTHGDNIIYVGNHNEKLLPFDILISNEVATAGDYQSFILQSYNEMVFSNINRLILYDFTNVEFEVYSQANLSYIPSRLLSNNTLGDLYLIETPEGYTDYYGVLQFDFKAFRNEAPVNYYSILLLSNSYVYYYDINLIPETETGSFEFDNLFKFLGLDTEFGRGLFAFILYMVFIFILAKLQSPLMGYASVFAMLVPVVIYLNLLPIYGTIIITIVILAVVIIALKGRE